MEKVIWTYMLRWEFLPMEPCIHLLTVIAALHPFSDPRSNHVVYPCTAPTEMCSFRPSWTAAILITFPFFSLGARFESRGIRHCFILCRQKSPRYRSFPKRSQSTIWLPGYQSFVLKHVVRQTLHVIQTWFLIPNAREKFLVAVGSLSYCSFHLSHKAAWAEVRDYMLVAE